MPYRVSYICGFWGSGWSTSSNDAVRAPQDTTTISRWFGHLIHDQHQLLSVLCLDLSFVVMPAALSAYWLMPCDGQSQSKEDNRINIAVYFLVLDIGYALTWSLMLKCNRPRCLLSTANDAAHQRFNLFKTMIKKIIGLVFVLVISACLSMAEVGTFSLKQRDEYLTCAFLISNVVLSSTFVMMMNLSHFSNINFKLFGCGTNQDPLLPVTNPSGYGSTAGDSSSSDDDGSDPDEEEQSVNLSSILLRPQSAFGEF
jgi:hypothetical protein